MAEEQGDYDDENTKVKPWLAGLRVQSPVHYPLGDRFTLPKAQYAIQ